MPISAERGGIGDPKAMVAICGIRFGIFRKYLPPSNEKIEPQRPSSQTGTTSHSANRAISSKPLRNLINVPVRLSSPSGKMQTISPFLILSDRLSERLFGLDIRDRYGFDQFENRGQPSDPIDRFMDDESNRSRASELQNDRIHIRHVIWHQQKARFRQIFESECS